MAFETEKSRVAVIGGGVTGTAIVYMLSRYTDIDSITLIEKHNELGRVNSNSTSNSQTLHFGDIETNYTMEKATKVKEAAEMVANYFGLIGEGEGDLYIRSHKMALAVGNEEIAELEKRLKEFKQLYPKLQKLDRDEIAKVEPEVVRGRKPKERIMALYSAEGYTIDYGRLAASYIREAKKQPGKKIQEFLGVKVESIEEEDGGFLIRTDKQTFEADVVVVAMGSHSLMYARRLGYGRQYFVLPVAGNFYLSARTVLKGKVYTMQNPKLPFAAVHGDPNIHNQDETRFGPTAKVIPILERRDASTFWDFMHSATYDLQVLFSLIKILSDIVIIRFILQNFIFDLPVIGTRSFVRSAQKIIPTLTYDDLKFGKNLGGIRPQLVDKKTGKMIMGAAEIEGKNILFNVTPSPGATASLGTAEKSVKKVIGFFGGKFRFDEAKLAAELKRPTYMV